MSAPEPALPPRPAPGTALLDAVAVMDRLRSPGGCPWDAAQTPTSLVRYLVEECFELVQAIEDGDPAAIREELGDVLLQVLFHARIAAESTGRPGHFTIDDVAADLVDKLVRRHPHVFADEGVLTDAGEQQQRWDELKKTEKGRSGPLAGVAMAAPSMALAGKLGARARKFDVHAELPAGDGWAEQVFRLAYAAGAAGEDPEVAVRSVARAHAERMRELDAG
ncbi:MAG: MazG family protein [Nakamurella sp.]